MGVWQLDEAHLGDEMTKAVKITLEHLHREGHLSDSVFEDYVLNTFITVKKVDKISTWWRRIFHKDSDDQTYKIFLAKQLTLSTDPYGDEDKDRDFKVISFGKEIDSQEDNTD